MNPYISKEMFIGEISRDGSNVLEEYRSIWGEM